MAFASRSCLVPVSLLFVARIFAAPTEPIIDGDHFRYLDREELGPFPQDFEPRLSPGGAQFRSRLSAILQRDASPVPDNSDDAGLSTGVIVLIVFGSVFGAILVLGCASLIVTRRARRAAKANSHSAWKGFAPFSPTSPIGSSMLSGSTLVSPTGTMDGRALMQVLAGAGLPVSHHILSNEKQGTVVRVEKPSSPARALLRSSFGFLASSSRRSSTSSRVLVIDQKSAASAGAHWVDEKPKVPPVPAVPRLISYSTSDGAKHVDGEAAPFAVPHTTASTGANLPYALSRQQTMQSIDSNVSDDDSIPPCPPVSPSTDHPASNLPSTHVSAPCIASQAVPINSDTPKPAPTTSPRILRVVNPKPKSSPRTNSNPLARAVVQRNMLHLAHSSRTHATAEPVQHPFAASAVVANGAAVHAPRPETLLRPPALRIDTTNLHVQGL